MAETIHLHDSGLESIIIIINNHLCSLSLPSAGISEYFTNTNSLSLKPHLGIQEALEGEFCYYFIFILHLSSKELKRIINILPK